jgi:ferritin-like metal-binding protein YciE
MENARELFLHLASSMYGAIKPLERSLTGIEKRTAETQLAELVGDLRAACSEQAKRLEEVFGLFDQRPSKEPSPAIAGFLEEEAMARRGRRAKQVTDLVAAKTASDVAQYSVQTFDVMLQLADHAGILTSSPKVGDALEVSMKEHRKLQKDLKKLSDALVEQLSPSGSSRRR